MRRPHPTDLQRPIARAPIARLWAELYCLGLTFVFHGGNNHIRKAVTLLLFAVWGGITVGLSFESVSVVQPPFYSVITGLVFLIIGRMWDIEVDNFATMPTGQDDGDDE